MSKFKDRSSRSNRVKLLLRVIGVFSHLMSLESLYIIANRSIKRGINLVSMHKCEHFNENSIPDWAENTAMDISLA